MSGKSTKKDTTTNTLDPKYDAAVYGNQQAANGLRDDYKPYSGDLVAGFTPQQLEAQSVLGNIGRGDIGTGVLNQATDAAGAVAGYKPIDVSAKSLNGMDLSGYLNPYTQDVVDTSTADIQRQREIALNQAKAQALKAGAWGGTGAAVLQTGVSDNYDRGLMETIAGLRSAGYDKAVSGAQFDIGNDLTAQQANQGAGLDANGQRLQASSVLGQLSDQQLQHAIQKGGILSAVGDTQQQQDQAGLSAEYQRYVDELNQRLALQQGASQATSIIPQTGTTNSTSVTKQTPGLASILGAVGSIAAGVATGGASLGLTGGLSSILGAAKGASSVLGGDVSQYAGTR